MAGWARVPVSQMPVWMKVGVGWRHDFREIEMKMCWEGVCGLGGFTSGYLLGEKEELCGRKQGGIKPYLWPMDLQ